MRLNGWGDDPSVRGLAIPILVDNVLFLFFDYLYDATDERVKAEWLENSQTKHAPTVNSSLRLFTACLQQAHSWPSYYSKLWVCLMFYPMSFI